MVNAIFAATGKREKTLAEFAEFLKTHPAAPLAPEVERQLAWDKVKELIERRAEPAAIASAIRITAETAQHHVPEIIAREIARTNARLDAAASLTASPSLA